MDAEDGCLVHFSDVLSEREWRALTAAGKFDGSFEQYRQRGKTILCLFQAMGTLEKHVMEMEL